MKQNNRPPQRPAWDGKKHLQMLVTLLAVWVGLFVIVLLEHGRSWAKLLPMLFVVILIYGAFVTGRLIKESSNRN